MKGETIFRAVGQISDDKVAEADAAVVKAVKPVWVRWAPLAAAACLVIALAAVLPVLLKPAAGPYYGDEVNEMGAYVYDDMNIYYLTGEGTIAYESVFIRFAPAVIFPKWAELNKVTDVTLVKVFIDSNGGVYVDERFPDMVSYKVGDYFIFNITVSPEFAAYAEGENGALLKEALERTFRGQRDSIDYDEFHIIIAEP
jgi:hypothetical protein